MSESNIKNIIFNFSRNWESYIKHCQNEDGNYQVKKDHKVYDLLISELANDIEKQTDNESYKITSSVGEYPQYLATIPWFAILHKKITNSTRRGYYISGLFTNDAKQLYLSIALGATQFEKLYGKNKKCMNKISSARNLFRLKFDKYSPGYNEPMKLMRDMDIDREYTNNSHNRAASYEAGCLFTKLYNLIDDDFSERDFLEDLGQYINCYEKIVADPTSEDFITNLDEEVYESSDVTSGKNYNYDLPSFKISDKQKRKERKPSGKHGGRSTIPSKKVGDAGEKYVYEYEKNKLIKSGRKDLADRIKQQYLDHSSYPGYDIQSFDQEGNIIYIEVKSTKSKDTGVFYISSNEYNAAKEFKSSYYIYQVTNALIDPIIFNVVDNLEKRVENKELEIEIFNYKIYV